MINLFFPEWVPWWIQFVVLIITVIFGICFLLMPFAVFGLKGRLNYLNQQMEDIQAQLRVLLKRTAEARERLQPKIQSVSNKQEESGGENIDDSEKKDSVSNTYIYPLSTIKKSSQCLDPADQDSFNSETYVNREKKEDIDRESQGRLGGSKLRQSSSIYVGNREDQVYDPPVFQEKKKEIISTRKKEPILRWPPK